MIVFRNVNVVVTAATPGHPDKTILSDVDLDLAEARICLIGANGSGKSTLLRLINGLRQPTTGEVSVNGVSAAAREIRSEVGFVFTDPLAQLIMPSPIEDLELSLRRLVRNRKERRAQAQSVLDSYGLGALAHQSVYDLSGGERQLVALASVLSVEPRVLVADEPTTLLDLRNTERLRRQLAELSQQVVFSTHNLDFARDADRVLVIDQSRVVADGAPSECLEFYRERMTQ